MVQVGKTPGLGGRPRHSRKGMRKEGCRPGSQAREWCHPLWAGLPTNSLVRTMPHRPAQRPVSPVLLDSVKLTTEISHHNFPKLLVTTCSTKD